MTDHEMPRYRFRGHVEPSAEVSRPAAAYRNATGSNGAAAAGSSATLDIFDVIDSYGGWWGISATEVDAALKQIGDVDTLYVRLNSPGGEATEGVAIANLLRAHKADVRVTVYGMAASAASYIACAGDTVSMGPGSLMFVHDAWDIALGDAADMRKTADTLDTISDSIAGLYKLKAGGTTDEWRAVMHADTWYSAEAAVAAKLADRVGLDPQLPADLPPVEEDDDSSDTTVIEIDVEISPAARAAARRFDLSMLPNAPAALALKTPAEPPVTPPTENKEADAMSDTENKGLRERLGLAEDAEESAVLAKVDELLEQATKPDPDKPAAAADPDAATVAAALAKDGKVAVSQTFLDEIKAQAAEGVKARRRQLDEDRDDAIKAAVSAGKISRDRAEHWSAYWDKDPEGAKAELDQLEARFPVGKPLGHQDGGENASAEVMTDDEAGALAALSGTSKEALING